ncbi:hypothetical protein [Nocardioides sp.]|uniref:hypothetical protein n=1 Tax=Nocardioides sp. TaxID=35761 RepID=UPI0025D32986|nr:hypothetical protein [Nocardioides sp.]
MQRHAPVLHDLVEETLRRVPASVAAEDLHAPGRVALAEAARSWAPDEDVAFADFARARIRVALVEALRSIDWSARGRRPRSSTPPALVGAARAAVAALPGDHREVIEGYFLHARSLPDLGDDLELDLPEVVALRNDALRSLRRTLAPVLAPTTPSHQPDDRAVGQSSSGSSGTGSPRTWNLR